MHHCCLVSAAGSGAARSFMPGWERWHAHRSGFPEALRTLWEVLNALAGHAAWMSTSMPEQAKAYTTRVGAGPYPTEIFGELGESIRSIGAEYGTTTGRPRRVGWLDIPALRYATRWGSLPVLATLPACCIPLWWVMSPPCAYQMP